LLQPTLVDQLLAQRRHCRLGHVIQVGSLLLRGPVRALSHQFGRLLRSGRRGHDLFLFQAQQGLLVSRQQVLGGAAHDRQLADALLLEKVDSFLQQLNGLDVVALEHLDRAQFFGNFTAFVRKQYAVRVLRILHLDVLVLERELHRIVVEVLED